VRGRLARDLKVQAGDIAPGQLQRSEADTASGIARDKNGTFEYRLKDKPGTKYRYTAVKKGGKYEYTLESADAETEDWKAIGGPAYEKQQKKQAFEEKEKPFREITAFAKFSGENKLPMPADYMPEINDSSSERQNYIYNHGGIDEYIRFLRGYYKGQMPPHVLSFIEEVKQ
jgi:hypothetical protein